MANAGCSAHPPAPPLGSTELDLLYTLPFTRRPHPAYGTARIPAYEMIKDSITTHRGYAGCSFCAIGAHQGTRISSRSQQSILDDIQLTHDPDFRGTISDLGGPTANMYGTSCRKGRARCREKSCLFAICRNLDTDHGAILRLMRAARRVAGVKHVFITSGIRCDLATSPGGRGYIKELAAHHVGGRLKIAQHVTPRVLATMRKSDAAPYRTFVGQFLDCSRQAGKPQQIIEYFMSGHPGCTLQDMIQLAEYLRDHHIAPEQVQDYYPVPLTLAAAMRSTPASTHSPGTTSTSLAATGKKRCNAPCYSAIKRNSSAKRGKPCAPPAALISSARARAAWCRTAKQETILPQKARTARKYISCLL